MPKLLFKYVGPIQGLQRTINTIIEESQDDESIDDSANELYHE